MTFTSHLMELRSRLIKSVIVLIVATLVAFFFARYIFNFLIYPAGDITLIYIEMTEMLGTYMRVSLMGGIIITMPYIVYHIIMFISPALTRREKKYIYVALPWITIMFLAGLAFGYFVAVPPAVKFLTTFGSEFATPQIKIGNYISIVTRLLIAIGCVFQTPVIITLLARLGVVTPETLAKKRRWAIVFAFIVAALVTPTIDPINQSIVAVPLIILYEMSIWMAKLAYRKRTGAQLSADYLS